MPPYRGSVFFNPSSGVKQPPGEHERMREAFAAAGLEVFQVNRDLNIESVIREQMDRGRRLFIAGGGDGTINHVVQALAGTEAVLGVLPLGTYNHFARDLGLPADWREALEVTLSGSTKQIDSGRANHRVFVNNISLGIYPEMVIRREEKGRDYPRWKARLVAFLGTLRHYPHESFAVETAHHREAVRTQLFLVSNNSYDLSRIGIEAARNTLEEGRLSVYWLPKVPRMELIGFVAHYLRGSVRSAPGFRSFRTAGLKIYSPKPRLRVGMDGEVIELTTPMTVSIQPSSLNVKVPRK